MILKLKAMSKKGIVYIPEYLTVQCQIDGCDCDLSFDLQGTISYRQSGLDCIIKGDLIPWRLLKYDTSVVEELDLSCLPQEWIEKIFPSDEIANIIGKSQRFTVQVVPKDEDVDMTGEIIWGGDGNISVVVDTPSCYEREFEFCVEVL